MTRRVFRPRVQRLMTRVGKSAYDIPMPCPICKKGVLVSEWYEHLTNVHKLSSTEATHLMIHPSRNPKTYRTIATFRSKSHSDKVYTVKVDEVGRLSCNCPQWVYHPVKGVRDCYHVRVAKTEFRPLNPGRTRKLRPFFEEMEVMLDDNDVEGGIGMENPILYQKARLEKSIMDSIIRKLADIKPLRKPTKEQLRQWAIYDSMGLDPTLNLTDREREEAWKKGMVY